MQESNQININPGTADNIARTQSGSLFNFCELAVLKCTEIFIHQTKSVNMQCEMVACETNGHSLSQRSPVSSTE